MKTVKYLILAVSINIVLTNNFEFVEYNFNQSNIHTFYLSSFDMVTGSTDIEFFKYGIRATNPLIYEMDDLELILKFSITITSPMIGYNSPTEIIKGNVRITNITEEIIFDNTDLNINTTRIGNSIFAVDITSQPGNDQIGDIANAIIQMGKLPNGLYSVHLDLYQRTNQGDIFQAEVDLEEEIYFPIFLELTTPGGSSLSDTLENSIFTTYPVFQWESDYCPSCNYGIRVSEFNPVLHSSFSEAINDVSNIPIAQSQDYLDIGSNITQFQFPLSGAIDLQIGKLYVWQISRTFETTIGTNLAKSNIFLFKIKSVSESREMLDSYSSTIIDFIGESTYNQYFGSNGDLSGFSLSGNSILINNESVPIGQLNNFSNQLNQGAISIISIEVE